MDPSHTLKNQDLQAEINAIDQESAQLESGVEQSVVKKMSMAKRNVSTNRNYRR
jgi:hypothetical protein